MFWILLSLGMILFVGGTVVRKRARTNFEGVVKRHGISIELPLQNSDQQLVALFKEGYRAEAVRIYRIKHGTGLKQSKETLQAMSEGIKVSDQQEVVSASPVNDKDVQALLEAQKKVQAIKLLRQRYNLGLADAKQALSQYERERG
jgi:ribosomal protein L7/L12